MATPENMKKLSSMATPENMKKLSSMATPENMKKLLSMAHDRDPSKAIEMFKELGSGPLGDMAKNFDPKQAQDMLKGIDMDQIGAMAKNFDPKQAQDMLKGIDLGQLGPLGDMAKNLDQKQLQDMLKGIDPSQLGPLGAMAQNFDPKQAQDMLKGSGYATLGDMASGAFNQVKTVTKNAKKNAVLDAYCNVIIENKDAILNVLKESIQEYIKNLDTNLDKEKMQEFIDSIILSQISTSILEDYFVKHAFVKQILNDKSIQVLVSSAFHEYTALSKGSQEDEEEDKIDNVVNGIYDKIVHILKIKPTTTVGGKRIVGGADATASSNDKIVAEIGRWFKNNGKQNMNDSIAYIIKRVIREQLDTKEIHNEIYKTLTDKIETHVDASIQHLLEGGVGLKKSILYLLLTNKKSFGIQRTFKFVIKQILNDAAKESIMGESGPESDPSDELPAPTTITMDTLKKIPQDTIIDKFQKYFDPHPKDDAVNKTVKELYNRGTGGKPNNKNMTNRKNRKNSKSGKRNRKTRRRL
jgi:hypothetical protein